MYQYFEFCITRLTQEKYYYFKVDHHQTKEYQFVNTYIYKHTNLKTKVPNLRDSLFLCLKMKLHRNEQHSVVLIFLLMNEILYFYIQYILS
jgi:hypothetical protein